METMTKSARALVPGTPGFARALKMFHKEVAKYIDEKIKSGLHEPGHGSDHIETTLYFFFNVAFLIKLTEEQKHIGALATIMHDIWRENTHVSHTNKSAKMAREFMRNTAFLKDENVFIDENTQNLVVAFVKSHSIQSGRASMEKVPGYWRFTLQTLQTADILASSGAWGYLRSFSYSGHALKSLLNRVQVIVREPTKYQDPLPKALRRLFGESHNHFHAWILSIALKTNRNYLEKLTLNDALISKVIKEYIKSGADPKIVEKNVGFKIEVDNATDKISIIGLGDKPQNIDSMFNLNAMKAENKKHASYFNEMIDDLNALAVRGIKSDGSVETDIVNDVLSLMKHGVIGLCGRAFWNQSSPLTIIHNREEQESEYLALSESVDRFSKAREVIRKSPEKAALKTEKAKEILQKIYIPCDDLLTSAQKQFDAQRWTLDMWDGERRASC